ncbi:MAG: cytochrome c biogenesis CcdA family protein [Cyanobacteria bacterium P01_H01_bin.74]
METPDLISVFYSALQEQSVLVVGMAFAGGILSSLLPCTVGMLPILIGYIGAYEAKSRWDILGQTILFVMGFATVLTVLGIAATLLGTAFSGLIGDFWYYGIALIAILAGLQLMDVIHIPLPPLVQKMPAVQRKQFAWLQPYLMGLAFGATASPCGTPFLTGILGLMSTQKNWLLSAASLFSYALGQSVLLIFAGFCTGIVKKMATLRQVGWLINRFSGIVFIAVGLLLILQALGWF